MQGICLHLRSSVSDIIQDHEHTTRQNAEEKRNRTYRTAHLGGRRSGNDNRMGETRGNTRAERCLNRNPPSTARLALAIPRTIPCSRVVFASTASACFAVLCAYSRRRVSGTGIVVWVMVAKRRVRGFQVIYMKRGIKVQHTRCSSSAASSSHHVARIRSSASAYSVTKLSNTVFLQADR